MCYCRPEIRTPFCNLCPPKMFKDIEALRRERDEALNGYAVRDDEVTGLSGMLRECKEQLAAMTAEKDEWKAESDKNLAARFDLIGTLISEQAYSQQLREALEAVECMTTYANESDEVGAHGCCNEVSYKPHASDCWTHKRTAALALPHDDTALKAWGAKLLRKAADQVGDVCRDDIRSMADALEQKCTHKPL